MKLELRFETKELLMLFIVALMVEKWVASLVLLILVGLSIWSDRLKREAHKERGLAE